VQAELAPASAGLELVVAGFSENAAEEGFARAYLKRVTVRPRETIEVGFAETDRVEEK